MAISFVSTPDFREGVLGLSIGQIQRNPGDTFFLNPPNPYFVVDAQNNLSLGSNYSFDFETKKINYVNATIVDSNLSTLAFESYNITEQIPSFADTTEDVKLNFLINFDGTSGIPDTLSISFTDTPEAIDFTDQDIRLNEYGASIGTISLLNVNQNLSDIIIAGGNDYFEISGNELKLKSDVLFTGDRFDKDPSSGFFGQDLSILETDPIYLGFKGAITSGVNGPLPGLGFSTSINKVDFNNIGIDNSPLITLNPIPFNELEPGVIIGALNYTKGTATPTFEFLASDGSVISHNLFEIVDDNKLKLKDEYFVDNNNKTIVKKSDSTFYDLNGPMKDNPGDALFITAKVGGVKVATEDITIGEIVNTAFTENNVVNNEFSYTYAKDLKVKVPTKKDGTELNSTNREEYQKNTMNTWDLKPGEKIQVSYLDNSSNHHTPETIPSSEADDKFSYLELVGDKLETPNEYFKTTHNAALNSWSNFIDVEFEEFTETGNKTGDWRIGLFKSADFPKADAAAYATPPVALASGGNIFYNGIDDDNNGLADFKQDNKAEKYSYNFSTMIHEIGHSLGLKHPFEDMNGKTSSDPSSVSGEIAQDKYDQLKYSVMSYTNNRNPLDLSEKYTHTKNLITNETIQPSTPMLYDILALQEVYGEAKNIENGNNTYQYSTSNLPYDSIFDTGGFDILDLSGLEDGSDLYLTGQDVSSIGEYFQPMKQDGTLGAKQGAVLSIIGSTEIEHVKLPGGKTNITSGDYSTFVEGKLNEQIELVVNSDQIGMQASGVANDLIKLAQTSVNWGSDVQALHTGNASKGATSKKISDLTKYLKHDISIDAADGNDKLLGTTGNDAIFLHNLVTKGDLGWLKNKTGSTDSIYEGNRLLNLEEIDLSGGDNFLDLSGSNNSLKDESITINVGSGSDILWLSDANETVNTGLGDDEVIINGGNDTIITGNDSDKITIANNVGSLTISDFDASKDELHFETSINNVSASGNTITVSNTIGDYIITLIGNNMVDLTGGAFNFL